MGGEVYADLLFLVNFSMDFLCFYLCARLLHRPLTLLRGMVASALGGVYAVAVLFLTVDKIPAFLIDATVCVALCAVAMAGRKETWRSLLRLSGLYLLVSMLLGGVMTALFSQLNRIPGLTDRVVEEGLSVWIFFGMALLSALLTALGGKTLRRTTARRPVTVIIEEKGRRVELEGICDTGNLLCDPISGRPVIVLQRERMEGTLPLELLRVAGEERVSEAVATLPPELARRVRLIPAKGATGARMLIGFVPDRICLREKTREEYEVAALIAPGELGQGCGVPEAVVPRELMNG